VPEAGERIAVATACVRTTSSSGSAAGGRGGGEGAVLEERLQGLGGDTLAGDRPLRVRRAVGQQVRHRRQARRCFGKGRPVLAEQHRRRGRRCAPPRAAACSARRRPGPWAGPRSPGLPRAPRRSGCARSPPRSRPRRGGNDPRGSVAASARTTCTPGATPSRCQRPVGSVIAPRPSSMSTEHARGHPARRRRGRRRRRRPRRPGPAGWPPVGRVPGARARSPRPPARAPPRATRDRR
jgi:hypothetical protein